MDKEAANNLKHRLLGSVSFHSVQQLLAVLATGEWPCLNKHQYQKICFFMLIEVQRAANI